MLLLTTDGGFFCDYATYACPHALDSLEEADGRTVNCLGMGTMQEAAGVPRSWRWAPANAQPSLTLPSPAAARNQILPPTRGLWEAVFPSQDLG